MSPLLADITSVAGSRYFQLGVSARQSFVPTYGGQIGLRAVRFMKHHS
jgi:hypothetical protein